MVQKILKVTLLLLMIWHLACSSSSDSTTSTTTTTTTTTSTTSSSSCYGAATSIGSNIPSWISDNFTCSTITKITSGGVDYYQFETDDLPPHKSPYWGTSSSYYEAMPAGNTAAVSSFTSQTYVLKIPVNPTAAASNMTAPGVAAGISTNGVVFFFGEASPGNSLSAELSTFDSAQGHPDGGFKRYHYHAEPKYISNYETALLGVMIDGYPIYGPKEEDGTTPSTTTTTGSSNQYPILDNQTYAHSHATSHFPSGIMHYHISNWDTSVGIPSMPIYLEGQFTITNITY